MKMGRFLILGWKKSLQIAESKGAAFELSVEFSCRARERYGGVRMADAGAARGMVFVCVHDALYHGGQSVYCNNSIHV